jgi:hypothetical protein
VGNGFNIHGEVPLYIFYKHETNMTFENKTTNLCPKSKEFDTLFIVCSKRALILKKFKNDGCLMDKYSENTNRCGNLGEG